jgi:signal transduction histidine kinase
MNPDWNLLIIPVFFFYGLAFYSMGFALLIESGRASELGFARSMRLLAGFGLLHGIHEWIDFLKVSLQLYDNTILPYWVSWLQIAVLVSSFLALLAFGEHLRALDRHDRMRIPLLVLAVVWYAVSCIVIQLANGLDEQNWIIVCDVLARYILGIPACVVAGLVLFRQRKTIEKVHMRRFTVYFTVAAVSIIVYGIIGQIFVNEAVIFPANIINSQLFIDIFGFPVQVLRAVVAVIIAISMISALRVLEIENQQRLASIDKARLETEHRSSAELSRLNASLLASEAEARQLLIELRKRDTLRTEFLQRVTLAQESERKRIARELHDGTGQMLTGLALGLRGLSTQVKKRPDHVITRLSDLETMATTAIGELRTLIQDLRPPQLDDMGLIPAIRSMLERFKNENDPKFELKITGDPYTLSSEVETILFRIIQEGVTNVTKHAHANNASITIDYKDNMSVCICDDGAGCQPEVVMGNTSSTRTAWGLRGIEERANLINATWTFDSQPNGGTQLRVHLPQPVLEPVEEVNGHDN